MSVSLWITDASSTLDQGEQQTSPRSREAYSQSTQPALNFLNIWNMCFGFLGIQFGFALQNANMSRIFQTLGADIETLPLLWLAAPITGLLVQPLVGYWSDRTWSLRFGRRKPYFFCGAMATTACLVFMPNVSALWMAAGLLWMLDAAINVSMEPFRALVADCLPPSQRPLGFSLQSFFIGIGAVTASAFPWLLTNVLGVDNTAAAGVIPDSVRYAFYAGALVLAVSVGWSCWRTREYSPEQLQKFAGQKPPTLEPKITENSQSQVPFYRQLFITAIRLPKVFRQLFVVQFFSWFALFTLWIYSTQVVTERYFGTSDPTSSAYNQGADWVGVLFAAYNGFAALAALWISPLSRKLGLKRTHQCHLLAGALGFASMIAFNDSQYLLLSMIGIGMAWASILSIPYALLSQRLPTEKMGEYLGLFNASIVLPQIVAAALLGFWVAQVLSGKVQWVVMLGAGCWVLAAIAMQWVTDTDQTTNNKDVK